MTTTNPNLAIEIQNAAGSWVDHTTNVRSVSIHLGFGRQRQAAADVGSAEIDLLNKTKAYSPASTGIDSGPIDNRRRVRIKHTSDTMGNILSLIHTGAADTAWLSQTVTNAFVATDVFVFTFYAR